MCFFSNILVFCIIFFSIPAVRWVDLLLSGVRTMGRGWRGAAGTLPIRTGGSRYLSVTLLLLLLLPCGCREASAQTDDGKSVYFWETGTVTRTNH